MTEHTPMYELMKNREAYNAMRDELEREHYGRIALLHGGELVSIYNVRWDAYVIGSEHFGEGRFSIKKIGEPLASLGAATLYTEPAPIE